MEIVYKKEQATNVFQVELVYVINNKVKMAIMNEEDNCWKYDLNLTDGEYLYKFIINNGIRINDPNANKYVKWVNGETWSMLKIHNGNIVPRMYPKTEFANFRVHNGTTGLGCKSVTYQRRICKEYGIRQKGCSRYAFCKPYFSSACKRTSRSRNDLSRPGAQIHRTRISRRHHHRRV